MKLFPQPIGQLIGQVWIPRTSLDLAHELERVSRLAVHLVYKGKIGIWRIDADFEQFDGLRLDTFDPSMTMTAESAAIRVR